MSDQEIIERLNNFDDQIFKTLYYQFKEDCMAFMKSRNADEWTNEEIYQDAVPAFVKNFREGKFTLGPATIKTYLISICLYKLINWQKKKKPPGQANAEEFNESGVGLTTQFDYTEEIESPSEKSLAMQLEAMRLRGEVCYELLRKFYFENKTTAKIAELMGYTNADNVKNQVYRCRERLRRRM